MKVMLDLDGVVANFCYGFGKFLNDHYNCTMDLDRDPPGYGFDSWEAGIDKIDFSKAAVEFLSSGGFRDLPTYENVDKFINQLKYKCDIYVCTARLEWGIYLNNDTKDRIITDTYAWCEQYGIPTAKISFKKDKIQFCKDNQIKLMIEDKLETAQQAAQEGIECILANRRYNQSLPTNRVYRIYNLKEVGRFI